MNEAYDELVARHRAAVSQQPATDVADLAAAIKEFEAALPGWWFSVGVCSLTRDASCGPDVSGPDFDLLIDRTFDEGFHCDDADGTLASSLRDVMEQALEARAEKRAAQSALSAEQPT